jgi:hypothetical protein
MRRVVSFKETDVLEVPTTSIIWIALKIQAV